MKTIIEKAEDYIKREPNASIKSAYLEGCNETMITIIDKLRTRYEFARFTLEDVAKIISIIRTGECNYRV